MRHPSSSDPNRRTNEPELAYETPILDKGWCDGGLHVITQSVKKTDPPQISQKIHLRLKKAIMLYSLGEGT